MSATPGPWQVCDGREHGVETLDGEWICDCIETPDNARLIAAAPELLKFINLCEQETACFKTDSLSHLQFVTETLNAMAQELIRKIQG